MRVRRERRAAIPVQGCSGQTRCRGHDGSQVVSSQRTPIRNRFCSPNDRMCFLSSACRSLGTRSACALKINRQAILAYRLLNRNCSCAEPSCPRSIDRSLGRARSARAPSPASPCRPHLASRTLLVRTSAGFGYATVKAVKDGGSQPCTYPTAHPAIPWRCCMPAPRKPDQTAPRPTSPTGATNGESPDPDPRAQSGNSSPRRRASDCRIPTTR